jgi:hypothetical protein
MKVCSHVQFGMRISRSILPRNEVERGESPGVRQELVREGLGIGYGGRQRVDVCCTHACDAINHVHVSGHVSRLTVSQIRVSHGRSSVPRFATRSYCIPAPACIFRPPQHTCGITTRCDSLSLMPDGMMPCHQPETQTVGRCMRVDYASISMSLRVGGVILGRSSTARAAPTRQCRARGTRAWAGRSLRCAC